MPRTVKFGAFHRLSLSSPGAPEAPGVAVADDHDVVVVAVALGRLDGLRRDRLGPAHVAHPPTVRRGLDGEAGGLRRVDGPVRPLVVGAGGSLMRDTEVIVERVQNDAAGDVERGLAGHALGLAVVLRVTSVAACLLAGGTAEDEALGGPLGARLGCSDGNGRGHVPPW